MDTALFLGRDEGPRLAYRTQPGTGEAGLGPTLVFLPGFNSNMDGTKAEHLAGWCAARGHGFVRFDYGGHGQSDGQFVDGTISAWLADALAIIDQVVEGPLVLVGSSMGGWIALLVALARAARVVGVVGIAAAPDFTQALMWEAMAPGEQERLMREGCLVVPNAYGPPVTLTRGLIEDGRRHCLLGGPIALEMPVRLLHGLQDAEVPWEHGLALARGITGGDVQLTLVKDAGHRLSRPSDLAVLDGLLDGLLGVLAGR